MKTRRYNGPVKDLGIGKAAEAAYVAKSTITAGEVFTYWDGKIPKTTIAADLSRLHRHGLLDRVKQGVYRARPELERLVSFDGTWKEFCATNLPGTVTNNNTTKKVNILKVISIEVLSMDVIYLKSLNKIRDFLCTLRKDGDIQDFKFRGTHCPEESEIKSRVCYSLLED